jgi:hypothetical protein
MRGTVNQVFHCPSCGRVIRTTADRCKYCGTPIDRAAAEAAAAAEETLHEAEYDASLLEAEDLLSQRSWNASAAPAMLWFVLGAPIHFVRFWIRYRRVGARDPEFEATRRKVSNAFMVWIGLAIATALYLTGNCQRRLPVQSTTSSSASESFSQ